MVTVRTFFAIAAVKNWELHQMDVHNAFLHGDLSEEIYMKLPPRFNKGCPELSYSDYSLFTLCKDKVRLHVLVYIDDLILTSNNSNAVANFKKYLSSCFHMKDLGVPKYFLGVEVARSREGIFFSQRKYVIDIISETGVLGSKPVGFPMEQNQRPAIHVLSQFLHEPCQDHWTVALRVVKYLKGCPGQGILLSATSALKFSDWCDSDWASRPITRRSVSEWIVFLGDSPVSWNPIELFCDSQSTLHLAQNPVFHERTKHIEIDCHFLRDAVLDGTIRLTHVSTTNQLTNIFSKALGR
ncbi:hypothetical protein LIER_01596 [Lithospermum erythrorhizon]|uniref:Reverse transcriptase Ty1/copia-type domain-containing protein n=1 Tax=Lithospermum erythrorhizon TaxID=34254 RepID=A0AAV3NR25_LITER